MAQLNGVHGGVLRSDGFVKAAPIGKIKKIHSGSHRREHRQYEPYLV